MKSSILIVFLQFSWLILCGQGWDTLYIGNGIKADISTFNGTAKIAYMVEKQGGAIYCATIDTTKNISIQKVIDGYFYGPLDIEHDKNGLAGIPFHDHNREDLMYAYSTQKEWLIEQIESVGHDGWDGSVSFDSDNVPHTISVDPSSGIELAYRPEDRWIVEHIRPIPSAYKFATDIKIDQKGIHTVYRIDSERALYYSLKIDSVWNHELIAENAFFPSLSIDIQGNVSVAYYISDETEKAIYVSHSKDSNWIHQKVADVSDIEISFSGARKVVDLEWIDDKLNIAYCTKNSIFYGQYDNDQWNLANIYTQDEGSNLGQQISMDFDDNGRPHLAFFIRDNTLEEGGKVFYLYDQKEDSQAKVIHISLKDRFDQNISNAEVQFVDSQFNILSTKAIDSEIALSNMPEESSKICIQKIDNPSENVSIIDLVRMQNLILGLSVNCKIDHLAADVDGNGSISVTDLVQMILVILGKNDSFSTGLSYRFYPSHIDIESLNLSEIHSLNCIEIDQLRTFNSIEFRGIKIGDLHCIENGEN